MSGIETLRSSLLVFNIKSNSAILAKEMGVATTVLDDFQHSRSDLNTDLLQKLALYVFSGFATYDADIDQIVPTNQEPAKALHSAPLPAEQKQRPQLSKDARRPNVGMKVCEDGEWDPKLDRLRPPTRNEQRGI